MIVIVHGSIPGMTICCFFLESIENRFLLIMWFQTNFDRNKIHLEAQFLIVKIKQLSSNCF